MNDNNRWQELGCLACRHWDGAAACKAFPLLQGGIPIEIASGQYDHRKPHPGDHGIRFEPANRPRTPAT